MTKRDALAEARRRWGNDAAVETGWYMGQHYCNVLVLVPGKRISYMGHGASFHAAFADADRPREEA